MQPHHYLLILRKRWVVALTAFLATSALTVVFASRQPALYESSATYVVRPRTASADTLRATDTLIRGVEIHSTYATIVRSDLIEERAKARLGPGVDTSETSVGSRVITETNIVEISVTGPDPVIARDLAVAIGRETVAYVSQLGYTFELEPLDPPKAPSSPVAPNTTLTIATGVVSGAALAVCLALLVERSAAAIWASRRADAGDRDILSSSRSLRTRRVPFDDEDDEDLDGRRESSGHRNGRDRRTGTRALPTAVERRDGGTGR
jgi:capsular polysaccharide biosynthesis protein